MIPSLLEVRAFEWPHADENAHQKESSEGLEFALGPVDLVKEFPWLLTLHTKNSPPKDTKERVSAQLLRLGTLLFPSIRPKYSIEKLKMLDVVG
jgi:hypothetical protein